MSDESRVECEACSWQGRDVETNGMSCPECGGECHYLSEMYQEQEGDEE